MEIVDTSRPEPTREELEAELAAYRTQVTGLVEALYSIDREDLVDKVIAQSEAIDVSRQLALN